MDNYKLNFQSKQNDNFSLSSRTAVSTHVVNARELYIYFLRDGVDDACSEARGRFDGFEPEIESIGVLDWLHAFLFQLQVLAD